MISNNIPHIDQYQVLLTRHALRRAYERGITPDMIEATIRGGKREPFGKNRIRFTKPYRRGVVVCMDEVRGETITIVTVEVRHEKMR